MEEVNNITVFVNVEHNGNYGQFQNEISQELQMLLKNSRRWINLYEMKNPNPLIDFIELGSISSFCPVKRPSLTGPVKFGGRGLLISKYLTTTLFVCPCFHCFTSLKNCILPPPGAGRSALRNWDKCRIKKIWNNKLFI